MNSPHDSRFTTARRVAVLAWAFMTGFLAVIMAASYLLGNEPHIFGLPAWIAIGNVLVPIFFVGLLVVIVERFIPDVSLDDEKMKDETPGEGTPS